MAYWHTGVLKVIRLYDMKKTWIMLTSNSVKVDKSNSKGLSKEFIKDLYQRDCIAKEKKFFFIKRILINQLQ